MVDLVFMRNSSEGEGALLTNVSDLELVYCISFKEFDNNTLPLLAQVTSSTTL
jgi:hypothetical protein